MPDDNFGHDLMSGLTLLALLIAAIGLGLEKLGCIELEKPKPWITIREVSNED